MEILQLINEIERSFSYLFKEYGFEIVFSSETGKDKREKMIGLDNGEFRMKFFADTTVSVMFAEGNAPFNRDDPKQPRWIRFSTLSAYLDQTPVDWGLEENVTPAFLEKLAIKLESKLSHILTLLKSQDEWIDSFRRFEEKAENSFFSQLLVRKPPKYDS